MWEFEHALTALRGLAYPCAPPIGVGEFDVLYASASEVVVWYSPVREGQRAGEVAIPCARLAAAWAALTSGATLDEAALAEYGAGIAGGRWLLALLALLPGVRIQPDPLMVVWSPFSARKAAAPAKTPRARHKAPRVASPSAAARSPRKPAALRQAKPVAAKTAEPG